MPQVCVLCHKPITLPNAPIRLFEKPYHPKCIQPHLKERSLAKAQGLPPPEPPESTPPPSHVIAGKASAQPVSRRPVQLSPLRPPVYQHQGAPPPEAAPGAEHCGHCGMVINPREGQQRDEYGTFHSRCFPIYRRFRQTAKGREVWELRRAEASAKAPPPATGPGAPSTPPPAPTTPPPPAPTPALDKPSPKIQKQGLSREAQIFARLKAQPVLTPEVRRWMDQYEAEQAAAFAAAQKAVEELPAPELPAVPPELTIEVTNQSAPTVIVGALLVDAAAEVLPAAPAAAVDPLASFTATELELFKKFLALTKGAP